MEANPNTSFIQWIHRPVVPQNGDLPQHLADGYGVRCQKELLHRMRINTLPCLGHGVLIRRSALVQTKGFTEVVSEVFAWSLFLLTKGQKGVIFKKGGFEEGFPQSYADFSSRYARWCCADLECAIGFLPLAIRAKNIKFVSKLDLFVRQIRFALAPFAIFFAFLLVLEGNDMHIKFLLGNPILAFLSVSAFCLPVINAKKGSWKKLPYLFIDGIAVCYSQLWVTIYLFLKFIVKQRAPFPVTGSSDTLFKKSWLSQTIHGFLALGVFVPNFHEFHPLLIFIGIISVLYIFHQRFSWSNMGCLWCR